MYQRQMWLHRIHVRVCSYPTTDDVPRSLSRLLFVSVVWGLRRCDRFLLSKVGTSDITETACSTVTTEVEALHRWVTTCLVVWTFTCTSSSRVGSFSSVVSDDRNIYFMQRVGWTSFHGRSTNCPPLHPMLSLNLSSVGLVFLIQIQREQKVSKTDCHSIGLPLNFFNSHFGSFTCGPWPRRGPWFGPLPWSALTRIVLMSAGPSGWSPSSKSNTWLSHGTGLASVFRATRCVALVPGVEGTASVFGSKRCVAPVREVGRSRRTPAIAFKAQETSSS